MPLHGIDGDEDYFPRYLREDGLRINSISVTSIDLIVGISRPTVKMFS